MKINNQILTVLVITSVFNLLSKCEDIKIEPKSCNEKKNIKKGPLFQLSPIKVTIINIILTK